MIHVHTGMALTEDGRKNIYKGFYIVGLGGMTVLRYTRVFPNTDGMIFKTVKNTDAFLSVCISVAPHNKMERRD